MARLGIGIVLALLGVAFWSARPGDRERQRSDVSNTSAPPTVRPSVEREPYDPLRTYATDEIRQLVADLKGNSDTRRRLALLRLVELGPEAKSALADLVESLDQKKGGKFRHVRVELVAAIVAIGPAAHDAVRELLSKVHYRARRGALSIIEQWGPSAPEFAPLLFTLAKQEHDDYTASLIGRALGALGETTRPDFVKWFSSDAWSSSLAIGYLAVQGKPAVRELRPFLSDTRGRWRVGHALAENHNVVAIEDEVFQTIRRMGDQTPLAIMEFLFFTTKPPEDLAPLAALYVQGPTRNSIIGDRGNRTVLLGRFGESGKRELITILRSDSNADRAARTLVSAFGARDEVAARYADKMLANPNHKHSAMDLRLLMELDAFTPRLTQMLGDEMMKPRNIWRGDLWRFLYRNDPDYAKRRLIAFLDDPHTSQHEIKRWSWLIEARDEEIASAVKRRLPGDRAIVDVEQDVAMVTKMIRRGRFDAADSVEALGAHGALLVPVIREVLREPNSRHSYTRIAMFRSVAAIGFAAHAAAPDIEPYLTDVGGPTRGYAHVAMFRVTGVQKYMRDAARDLNSTVRYLIYKDLGTTGSWAVPLLLQGTRDTNLRNARVAMAALKSLGVEGREAIPELRRLIANDDANESLRIGARNALTAIEAR